MDQYEGWRTAQVIGQTVKLQHNPRGEICAVEIIANKPILCMLYMKESINIAFVWGTMNVAWISQGGIRKETGLDRALEG